MAEIQLASAGAGEGISQLCHGRPSLIHALLRRAVKAVFLKPALTGSLPQPENPSLTEGMVHSPSSHDSSFRSLLLSRPVLINSSRLQSSRELSCAQPPGDRAVVFYPLGGGGALCLENALFLQGMPLIPYYRANSLSFFQNQLQYPFLWRASPEVRGLTPSLKASRNSLNV